MQGRVFFFIPNDIFTISFPRSPPTKYSLPVSHYLPVYNQSTPTLVE